MRALLLTSVLLSAAAPAALADEPPRTYRAVAPAIVHDAPSPAAAVLGLFERGAGPVEVTAEFGGWGRLPYRGDDGWIRLERLAPESPATLDAAPLPIGLLCAGAEPFWSLAFSGPSEAVRRAPDLDPVAFEIEAAGPALGRPTFPLALHLAASGERASGERASVIVRPGECSDGMSDMTYGWSVDVLFLRPDETTFLTGCCRLPIDD